MAGWLALAATPVFAAMAWGAATDPGPMALCSADPGGLPQSPDMFGVSVFARDEEGGLYHTYSTYHRMAEL